MTQNEKELVQKSFARIATTADVAAGLFYCRLFEIDPNLMSLFRGGDMKEQGRKLMQVLAFTVGNLDRLEQILPIHVVGERYARYGVTDKRYDTVANALLWTLEMGLGNAYTPEVRRAWVSIYPLIATQVTAGAITAGTMTAAA